MIEWEKLSNFALWKGKRDSASPPALPRREGAGRRKAGPFHLRFRTVSSPFPMAPLQLPRGGGIERKKRLSSPWFICSFYKQRPARPTSSQPNGNALGGQGVGVFSPCKGKSPISRQCFCPFRAKKNINHESIGRCPGLRAVALSGRWNYELWIMNYELIY